MPVLKALKRGDALPVTKLEVANRSQFANGESFGETGPYELVEGTVHFAVDPLHPRNQMIAALDLAPRDSAGKVSMSADFSVLKPVELGQGTRRLLFDVVNRGGKTALTGFNSLPASPDPMAPLESGNGFLMRQGYTVVWGGWQADLPANPGLVGLQAPQAVGPGGPLAGKILCQFQTDSQAQTFLLSHRGHLPHPPADLDDPSATLTVRNHPNDLPAPIDRGDWSFVRSEDAAAGSEPSHIYMPSGFLPGKIYQLVYTTKGSTIVGLGLAAVRDVVSFLKFGDGEAGNPCAGDIDYAYGYGRSQSGRFLRQMIHLGLNDDEEGRMALDGIIPHVGGAMRGEFNLRFGQPSQDICYISPERFPFTDTPQLDPVTGAKGSMLERLEEQGQVPKIMFTNTSAEYWRGDAALIHTDLEKMKDAAESPSVRRYHFAGCQHVVGVFPPLEVRTGAGSRGHLPFNSVDYSPLLRAALVNLDRWVSDGEPAPASRHPSLSDGTAVDSQSVMDKFTGLPGVRVAAKTTRALRLDYGQDTHPSRLTKLPAEEGQEYPALVSDIDEDFNDRAGIRLPDLTVPVATYTGWNLRDASIGNPSLFIGISGGLAGWTLPFQKTAADRETTGDPRRSISERYDNRDSYLRQVEKAGQTLVDEGYLLAEDLPRVVERAGLKYDYFMEETPA